MLPCGSVIGSSYSFEIFLLLVNNQLTSLIFFWNILSRTLTSFIDMVALNTQTSFIDMEAFN
jgi:hypothetical protein